MNPKRKLLAALELEIKESFLSFLDQCRAEIKARKDVRELDKISVELRRVEAQLEENKNIESSEKAEVELFEEQPILFDHRPVGRDEPSLGRRKRTTDLSTSKMRGMNHNRPTLERRLDANY